MLDETGENAEGTVTALKAELDAQYAPLGGPIVITSQSFFAITNTPAMAVAPVNRAGALMFDASAQERAQSAVWIPAGWTTVTATLCWANAGVGAGDVMWDFRIGPLAEGADISVPPTSVSIFTDTAGTQWVAQTPTSEARSVTAGQFHRVWIERTGSDAADTLANDAAFYALVLTRAS
jgi:hypothetical protein